MPRAQRRARRSALRSIAPRPVALGELHLDEGREQRHGNDGVAHVVQPPQQQRSRHRVLALRAMDRDVRRESLGEILVADEQAFRLLGAALQDPELRELGRGMDAPGSVTRCLQGLQCPGNTSLRHLEVALRLEDSAPQLPQKEISGPWRWRAMKVSMTSFHLKSRSSSPDSSQASVTTQQTSPKMTGSVASPPVTATIASSSAATPASNSPARS